MSDIQELTKVINQFFDERDWKQFHNPKDMAISLLMETTEVLEHFQWKNEKEVQDHIKAHLSEIKDEIADVAMNVFALAHDLNIDLKEAMIAKMVKNRLKYPIEKAKGKNKKYSEL
jgi:NTP pyrophosphatase (non-canonical NTP hydrolase)